MEKKVKILLIQGGHGFKSLFPPLGLGYIAAVAEHSGCEVKVIDMSAIYVFYSVKDIVKEVKLFSPDIVGMSINIASLKFYYDLIKILTNQTDALFIAGGPHPTLFTHEVLNHGFDIVVRGEGEETIAEIIGSVKGEIELKDILGISYRLDGKIVDNQSRPLIENLDKILFPAWHLFKLSDYIKKDHDLLKFGKIITSRGCPFNCTFCIGNGALGKRFRFRNPENVVEEIKYLYKNYGVKDFTFWDDAFTFNRQRVSKLCDLIRESNLKIKWGCTTRIDCIDLELLNQMKEAGCYIISYGIESFNYNTLKKIKKFSDLKLIKSGLEQTKQAGIKSVVNLILGFPWEDKKDYINSRRFIKDVSPLVFSFCVTILVPSPCTEIYQEYKDKYKFENWWLKFDDNKNKTGKGFVPFFRKIFYDDAFLGLNFFDYSGEIKREIIKSANFIGKLILKKGATNRLKYYIIFALVMVSKFLYRVSPNLEKFIFSGFILSDKVRFDIRQVWQSFFLHRD